MDSVTTAAEYCIYINPYVSSNVLKSLTRPRTQRIYLFYYIITSIFFFTQCVFYGGKEKEADLQAICEGENNKKRVFRLKFQNEYQYFQLEILNRLKTYKIVDLFFVPVRFGPFFIKIFDPRYIVILCKRNGML